MDPSSSGQALTLAAVPVGSRGTIVLIVVLLLILVSAFISVAETAFLNMSKGKLRFLLEEHVPKAERLNALLEDQESIYRTMTVGNSLMNVAAAALGTYWIVNHLPLTDRLLDLLIAIAIMTVMVLIFGEIIPETLGRKNPEKVSLLFLTPTRALLVLLRPFVLLFYGISSLILRLFGVRKAAQEPLMTKEEFKNIVDGSVEDGLLDQEEREIIENVTEFGALRVDDVMTQRYDMVALSVDAPYSEVLEVIAREKYSRMPVYRDTTDDVVGILNVKDLIATTDSPDFSLMDYVRPAFFTYEFKLVQDLFREMRRERSHLAIVLDEYGGTVGLVTIEDFLEAIVGDIDDEYDDEPETPIERVDEGLYEMDGATKLTDLADELDLGIESEDVDTIGGFLIERLGTFPEDGQIIPWQNLEFEVLETEKNRIQKVRIRILPHPSDPKSEKAEHTL